MKKVKVLMIDDNKQLVDMVKEYFSSHAVISLDLVANDGVEGLEAINKHEGEFDLVLLDLIMPKMDGLEILERLRDDSKLSNIPVIVITSDQLSEEKSLSLGAADFIPKPYPRQTVIKARIKRTIVLYEDRRIINYTERDLLTRLYNKEYFYQYASIYDKYYDDIMDALFIDIRHFHIINDRFGNHYSDEVLKTTASILKGIAKRLNGMVCRKEKDSFMLYLKHQDDYSFILDELRKKNKDIVYRIGVYENVDKNIDVTIRFDRAKLASDKLKTSMTKNIEYYNEKMREKELYEEQLIYDFEKLPMYKLLQVFHIL